MYKTDSDVLTQDRLQPTSESEVRFSVLVPAWNALRFLKITLPPLVEIAENFGGTEILIIDNGSTDGTTSHIKDHFPSVRIERIERVSIGAARNHAAQVSHGSVLCFIDADCLVEPGYFDHALRSLEQGSTHVTGYSYALPAEPGHLESVWHRIHERSTSGPTRLLPGGNLIISRTAFNEVGGFNEELITGEDADLCQRLIATGYQPYAERKLRVQHLGNPKTIRAFFRQHVWHSLGMFGRRGNRVISRPTIMTVAHLSLTVTGAAVSILMKPGLFEFLAVVFASQLFVPAISVAYRMIDRGGGVSARTIWFDAFWGMILYWLYFAARAYSMSILAFGKGRRFNKI